MGQPESRSSEGPRIQVHRGTQNTGLLGDLEYRLQGHPEYRSRGDPENRSTGAPKIQVYRGIQYTGLQVDLGYRSTGAPRIQINRRN